MIRNIRLFAAAVSVLLCAGASAQRYEGVVDKSIAVIGSELITLSDLEEQVRLSGYGRYTSGKSIRCETRPGIASRSSRTRRPQMLFPPSGARFLYI